jgi:hypothetical protein
MNKNVRLQKPAHLPSESLWFTEKVNPQDTTVMSRNPFRLAALTRWLIESKQI